MYDAVIELISERLTQDEAGIWQASEPEHVQVAYAEIENVSRDEWESAGQMGFNAEYRLRMPRSSYNGERALYYRGIRYGIYRSYERYGEIELYVEKKDGETNVG